MRTGIRPTGGCSAAARILLALLIPSAVLLATAVWAAGTHGIAVDDGPPAVWGTPLGRMADPEREQAMAELGRQLFFETRLSANDCMSCATCHRPELALTDGQATAVGIYGDRQPRNTPTLTNIAYAASLTWLDAGVELLEDQARLPLFNTEPPEMGLTSEAQVVDKLKQDKKYQAMFARAFPEQSKPLTLETILQSLAAFERTLVSYQSPFDRYVYQGDHEALSDSAKRGMQLFYSRRLGCVTCHHSWNFSAPLRTDLEPDTEATFHDTGLDVTEFAASQNGFKTPTLRNIAVTAPYMHDGRFKTLAEVITHYEQGGGEGVNKSGLLRQFSLTDKQRTDLIDFLNHLTDKQFIERMIKSDPEPDRLLPEHCSP